MEEENNRIKIKRSDGRVQYVTQQELEKLNHDRKLRDQSTASASPSSPFSRLIFLCVFAVVTTLIILWF